MTESASFLIGITIEPNEPGYEGFKMVSIDNPILPRSPQAGPDLVDLSGYYNASLDDEMSSSPRCGVVKPRKRAAPSIPFMRVPGGA